MNTQRTIPVRASPFVLAAVLLSACGPTIRPAPYAPVNGTFDPSAYRSIALQTVNTSTERLRGEARADLQSALVTRLSHQGYNALPQWSPPSPAERNVPAWEPGPAVSDSAARALADALNARGTLIVDVLDVRTEPYNGPTATEIRDSKLGVSTAHGAVRFSQQRIGVSVYARFVDRASGNVLWARKVGGWDVTLNDAVTKLVAQLPAR